MRRKNIFNRTYLELTGCIHIHTEKSFDSEEPVSKIIDSANKNGLDFITINDHRNKEVEKELSLIDEKDLLIIVGIEINDKENNNHYLVFNSDKVLIDKSVEEYTDYYHRHKAICFAAHPFEKRASSKLRKYIWTNRKNDKFDGLEIWNFLSSWMGILKPKFNGLFLILFPIFFVKKPLRKILSYWDELNIKGKRKSAIGSVDAHTILYKKFGITFKFLTHNSMFKTIRTNVLLKKDSEINNQTILTALKNGNSYIVNYKIGNPYNFYAGISDHSGNGVIFGEEINFQNKMKFYFRLPKIAQVILLRNGKKISKNIDDKGSFPIKDKGNYRLEISRFGYGWIYTNNIYIV